MIHRIILAGGGHAHLAVLADWAARPWPETERVLVTASRHTAYSGMLPGWMAGIYRAEDLLIDLAPLAEAAGARLIIDEVTGLEADRRRLYLASGATLEGDLLSLATGGEADLAALGDAGAHVLPVKPVDRFMAGWSALLKEVEAGRPVSLAVVGGGAAGVEIALAAEAALRASGAALTLVAAPDSFLRGHAPSVRHLARAELARRGIAFCPSRATAGKHGLLLSDGTCLPASHIIAATGSRAPGWLAASGLSISPAGFAAVDAHLCSTSHSAIFAAGDIVERCDRPLPRSGVHAVKAGPVLAANLRAALAGRPLRSHQPGPRTLYLMATGDKQAIGSYGNLAFAGRLAWWLKDWIDRRFVARYRRPLPSLALDKAP